MLKNKYILFLVFVFTFVNKSFATHIVGGEMIYDKIGADKYRIILKVYRDCFNGIPPFDGLPNQSGGTVPAYLTIREVNSSNLFGVFDIGAPTITNIPPTINSPCIQTPNNVCVEEGVYQYTITLPPIPGGYYIIYQRCCRNNTILNLTLSGDQGSTYYAKIPGSDENFINNSPRYKNFPPIFICNNVPFSFDHSAIDPDGDQLVYSLCNANQGLDDCCPTLQTAPGNCPNPPSSCPFEAPQPPYLSVIYNGNYTGQVPLSSNPAISINSTTGLLICKPNLVGQFVVNICVQEFRNGNLIDTHYREFQFNIVPCVVNVLSVIPPQPKQCQGNSISFGNSSSSNLGPMAFHWDFGVVNTNADTSNLATPSYNYQDTGKYVVSLITNPGTLCGDTAIDTVYVYPPLDVKFKPNSRQCIRGNKFTFNSFGTYVPSATTFTWILSSSASPSVAFTPTVSNVTYSTSGSFTITLFTKQYACIDTFIDTIRLIPRPKALIENLPTSLCNPARIALSNGSTSELPLNYLWQFSNGGNSTAFEPVHTFSPQGVYSVSLTVTTTSICIDTSMFAITNITVNPLPKAGFTYSPTLTTVFDPDLYVFNNASPDVVKWSYTFDGSKNANYFPYRDVFFTAPDYGDYPITQIVMNQYNCTDTLVQLFKVLPEHRFWVPNCFTPNGNDLNEFYLPIAIGVANYKFEIFDRWGEKLFTTTDPKQGWNGKFKGSLCKQDVYVWRISFKNVVTEKLEIKYGHVTLLRSEE